MAKARVFNLTKEIAGEVKELVERMGAPEKVIPFDICKTRADAAKISGEIYVEPDSTIEFHEGWKLGYTHEEIKKGFVFRRMWLAGPVKIPPKELTKLFCELCGFINPIENTVVFDHVTSHKPRRAAVNIVEPLSGDWAVMEAQLQ
jgi:hypothetical protein